jgi:hypothetical protein
MKLPEPSAIWRSFPLAPGISRSSIRLRFPLLLGDPLDRAVDVLIRHLDDEPLDIEIGEAWFRNFGQQLEGHLVLEVAALGERDDIHFWRHCRTQIVLAYRLGRTPLHGALQDLAEDRGAKPSAEDLHRDLAGTEARQIDGAADLA